MNVKLSGILQSSATFLNSDVCHAGPDRVIAHFLEMSICSVINDSSQSSANYAMGGTILGRARRTDLVRRFVCGFTQAP